MCGRAVRQIGRGLPQVAPRCRCAFCRFADRSGICARSCRGGTARLRPPPSRRQARPTPASAADQPSNLRPRRRWLREPRPSRPGQCDRPPRARLGALTLARIGIGRSRPGANAAASTCAEFALKLTPTLRRARQGGCAERGDGGGGRRPGRATKPSQRQRSPSRVTRRWPGASAGLQRSPSLGRPRCRSALRRRGSTGGARTRARQAARRRRAAADRRGRSAGRASAAGAPASAEASRSSPSAAPSAVSYPCSTVDRIEQRRPHFAARRRRAARAARALRSRASARCAGTAWSGARAAVSASAACDRGLRA